LTDELQLLRGYDYDIGNGISIHHPELSEISMVGEQEYYSMIANLCATPSDYKSILWDNYGIDYEEMGEFEFFGTLVESGSFLAQPISLVLKGINLSLMKMAKKAPNNELVLYDKQSGQELNELDYILITDYLRKMHGFEKHTDIAGTEATKRYLINKARKQLRNKRDKYTPILPSLISAMVNSEQFKYNYNTVWNLNIYQFMDAVRRIQKIKNAEQIIQGIYSGNIDSKKISKESLNWLGAL
jgi:hypothetical protein